MHNYEIYSIINSIVPILSMISKITKSIINRKPKDNKEEAHVNNKNPQ